MSKLKEVESYLETLGYSLEEIKGIETNRISLASAIMLYAHQGQKRINGEPYYHHPQRVYFSLRDFIGADDEGKNINEDWLDKYDEFKKSTSKDFIKFVKKYCIYSKQKDIV